MHRQIKRVLFFIDSLGSGGAQRQMVNLAIEFKGMGLDVGFLVYHPNEFYEKELIEKGITIELIHETRAIPRILKVRKFIRKGSFDAVISFLDTPNFIAELSGFPWKNWRLLVGERSADPKILQSKRLRFYRFMHSFSDAVVSNSETNLAIVKTINRFLDNKKCHVVYNMIDLEKWRTTEQYHVRANGKTNILIASSHQYLKNSRSLIEALNLMSETEKSKLSIKWYGAECTDNSLSESIMLMNSYQLNNVVEFLPPVNNIIDKMISADCCALFSFYEGLPNAICEGMALAKPVLATRVSDVPKLIDENVGGFLCEPNSIDSIVNGIRKILSCTDEQLLSMGIHNRKKAQLLFDKQKIVNSYLKILQDD